MSVNFDWKSLVRTVAPALATALGGPLAGIAVQTISTAVLGRPDGTDEEIGEAIQSGGLEALAAIKKAGNDFAVRMKELDIEVARLINEDRASAREREAKTADSATPRNLAYILTFGYFLFLGGLFLFNVPESARSALDIMLGALTTAWLGALAYYHGTTASGARKTEIIAKAEPVK